MNRVRPFRGGNPSRDDLDAAATLKENEVARVTLVRGRAEKWLAGLTALTGLLTTVLVAKGPQRSAISSSVGGSSRGCSSSLR